MNVDLNQGEKDDPSVETIFDESLLPENNVHDGKSLGLDKSHLLEKDYVSVSIVYEKEVGVLNKETSSSSNPSTERLDKQGHNNQGADSVPESSYSISPLLEDKQVS